VSSPLRTGIADEGPAALVNANVRIGVRLIASGVVFLFMAFLFAFFYLRALNSNHMFHPAGVNPPAGWGIVILVCVLATWAVFRRAARELAKGHAQLWRAPALAALALAGLVVVVQIVEYLGLGFKTASGGYASVFWGWTLVFLLSWLGGAYWIETLVAQTLRGEPEEEPGVMASSAEGCTFFLATLAVIQIVGYICLYLIK
jgi:heme/copper-type cytochrome/quinol oxidase subunit 3